MNSDELVDLIRARAEDPATRVESVPDLFSATLRRSSVSALGGLAGGLVEQLKRVARGQVDDEAVRRADQIRRAMTEPHLQPLPAPASADLLARAEAEMGVVLPPLLRRLYSEVANGGFGPGSGLIGVDGGWRDSAGRTIESVYEMLASGDPEVDSWSWPKPLLPVVDASPQWFCVETSGLGRVIEFDYEEIDYGGWAAAFTPVAGSLAAWLEGWARRPAPNAASADTFYQGDIDAARRSRETIALMSPEERRAMGLPDEGWERVVWGGIGLNEEDS